MEWISVKDRLPKPNERVLCVHYHDIGSIQYNETRVSVGFLQNDRFYDGGETDPLKYVTHWAPLPDLPKGAVR